MIQAIMNSLGSAVSAFITFIPRLVGFLVILLVGWLVGIGVDKAVTGLLRKVGFDRLSDRVGLTRFQQNMGLKADSAKILGVVAFWFIFLIFLVPAVNALGLPTVSNILSTLVDYLPNVFVAILAIFLGTLLGVLASDIVRGAAASARMGSPHIFGNIVRWAIIGFACLIALQQLQIAPALITVLFTAVMGALALAFGLAFGLGGREPAQRLLSRSEGRLLTSRPYDPNQIVQQAHADLSHSEQLGQQHATPEMTPPAHTQQAVPSSQAQQTVPPSSYGTQRNVPPGSSSYGTQQNVPPSPQNQTDPWRKGPTPGV